MNTLVSHEPELTAEENGPRSRRGEPTWEIARLHPRQGEWSEAAYLELETNHLVEYSDGELDFLPMPDLTHQLLSQFLFERLKAYVHPRTLGRTLFAPFKVRLGRNEYREPDVLFLRRGRVTRQQYAEGADLVIAVVSPGAEDRQRDCQDKRTDYAAGGIPEYWIVDRESRSITVLTLAGAEYQVHGVFGAGSLATSVLLPGFSVDVAECCAAATADE